MYQLPTATIDQIERQKRLEAYAVERGIARYRRSLAEADLADTKAGRVIMKEMMQGLEPAIASAQKEAAEGITSGDKGRKPQWWWLIAFLEPERLAYITIRSILSAAKDGKGKSQTIIPLLTVANSLGAAVKTEMEFDQWKRSEAEKAKDNEDHTNMANLLIRYAKGDVDTKTFKRWRKKLDSIERLDWTREQRVYLGTKLIELAIEHGSGWVLMERVYKQGRTIYSVRLSDLAREAITDINSDLEVARPMLLPMICPPKPWRKITNG